MTNVFVSFFVIASMTLFLNSVGKDINSDKELECIDGYCDENKEIRDNDGNEDDPVQNLQNVYRRLLGIIGEDIEREGLRDTPKRAAKAFLEFVSGYDQNLEEIVGNGTFDAHMKDMVIVKDIDIYSLCEHHLVPFYGCLLYTSDAADE
eukprot:TRINITY_DN10940_c0_g1_i2.p1 TRINITY_DN10940_c0_g1~~TRINITY_DN10940_c0_g1_i2.p1  ORF type:complete len:162 (-),score=31.25 TRINITY_DN10940_c0_g1_i2:23-469(-)